MITWDEVDCSSEAKAFLKEHGIKASVVSRMVEALGFENLWELEFVQPDHVAMLQLKPLEAVAFARMMQRVHARLEAAKRGAQALGHGNLAGPPPSQAPTLVQLKTTRLKELADMVAVARDPTVFDLGGATLRWNPQTDGAPTEPGITISADGVCLRNGIVELPDKYQVLVKGVRNVRLEGLTVRGPGCQGGFIVKGLVEVDGGRAALHACTVGGATRGSCCAIVVKGGANVEVVSCEALNVAAGSALAVQGDASRAAVKDCKFHGCSKGAGVDVMQGASVEVTSCEAYGNRYGMHVHGRHEVFFMFQSGSRAVALDCRFHGNSEGGVLVSDTRTESRLQSCQLEGNGKWSAAATGSGSKLVLRGCAMDVPVEAEGGAICEAVE